MVHRQREREWPWDQPLQNTELELTLSPFLKANPLIQDLH